MGKARGQGREVARPLGVDVVAGQLDLARDLAAGAPTCFPRRSLTARCPLRAVPTISTVLSVRVPLTICGPNVVANWSASPTSPCSVLYLARQRRTVLLQCVDLLRRSS